MRNYIRLRITVKEKERIKIADGAKKFRFLFTSAVSAKR
jgi:hypothetical protein